VHASLDPRHGTWITRELPGAAVPVYVDGDAINRSVIGVAYVAPDRDSPEPFDRNSVFFIALDESLYLSADPLLVNRSGTFDAYDPRIVAQGSVLHLLWRKSLTSGMTLWATRSLDEGRTWSVPAQLDEPGNLRSNIEVVAGPEGKVHAFYARTDGEVRRLMHTTLSDGTWSRPRPFLEPHLQRGQTWFDIVLDAAGNFHIAVLPAFEISGFQALKMLYWTVPWQCLGADTTS